MKMSLLMTATLLSVGMVDSPASAGERVNRLARWMGFGWSEGYHACQSSNSHVGRVLPPTGAGTSTFEVGQPHSGHFVVTTDDQAVTEYLPGTMPLAPSVTGSGFPVPGLPTPSVLAPPNVPTRRHAEPDSSVPLRDIPAVEERAGDAIDPQQQQLLPPPTVESDSAPAIEAPATEPAVDDAGSGTDAGAYNASGTGAADQPYTAVARDWIVMPIQGSQPTRLPGSATLSTNR